MTAQEYFEGDEAVVEILWSDPESATPPVDPATGHSLVNPTLVTAVAREPGNGPEHALTVTIDGYRYSARVPLPKAGTWWYGWKAEGNFNGYREGVLLVKQRRA